MIEQQRGRERPAERSRQRVSQFERHQRVETHPHQRLVLIDPVRFAEPENASRRRTQIIEQRFCGAATPGSIRKLIGNWSAAAAGAFPANRRGGACRPRRGTRLAYAPLLPVGGEQRQILDRAGSERPFERGADNRRRSPDAAAACVRRAPEASMRAAIPRQAQAPQAIEIWRGAGAAR